MTKQHSQPNNPAGRLLAILNEAKSRKQELRKATIAQAWAEILCCHENDRVRLLQKLSLVMKLPAQVKELVEADSGVNHSLFLAWMPKVTKALGNMNFENPWPTFADHLDDATIQALEFCDDRLKRTAAESQPQTDQLLDLLESVRSLIDDVSQASDLDPRLKEYVLTHLLRIERAIGDFRLQGIEPLQEAVQAAFGAVILQKQTASDVDKSRIGTSYWQAVLGAAVIAFSGNLPNMLTSQRHEIALPENLTRITVELLPEGDPAPVCDDKPDSMTDHVEEHKQSPPKK